MRSRMLSRRRFMWGGAALAGTGVLAGVGVLTGADRLIRPPQRLVPFARIGFLGPTFPDTFDLVIPESLAELGYVEGHNLLIEYRRAGGRNELLPELARELVRLEMDVVLVAGNLSAQAMKQATSTIPVVMAFSNDPVGIGIVESLARPGGNITGLTNLTTELGSKRIGLLKESIPGLTRVAAIANADNPGRHTQLSQAAQAAQLAGIQLQLLEVRDGADFAPAINAAMRDGCQAFLVTEDGLFTIRRDELTDLLARARLPAIYANGVIVRAGGLMSYGPNFSDQYRKAVVIVDKILKGAKPADLPVEHPTKFDFIVNLRTARALGLTLPPAVLQQATEIVE